MATTRASNTFHGLLAATAMGVYVLLLVGATTALTDAAAACTAWPACGDGLTLPSTMDGWVAFGHRIAAVLVGLLALVTLVSAWRSDASRRVKATVTASTALYPAQAGLGAVVATVGASASLSTLHLVVGMAIFGGLLVALAWTLEEVTGDPTDKPVGAPSRDLPPAEEQERPAVPTEPIARAKATAWAYFRLMKPRLMWLLCLVASAAMTLAGTVSPGLSTYTILATLGGGVLSIGASGTFNHVLERDVDRRMQRTSDRPLAVDLVPVRNAIAFGVALAIASVALFASVNWLAAVLGLVAIAFYSVVYTLILKPNTVQNTVIGGAAGALPALIGWVAVTGDIGLGGVVLAIVIFLWTPAHFYNLALAYKDDYARGGFPMMPVVRGETETRKHIVWWLGATLIAAAGLAVMDALGVVYFLTSVVFGGAFLYFVVRLHYERDDTAAFRAFHASNAYLGMLLLAIVVDTLAL
ncbi:protoheme IX farnesyltransferase [Haloferax sp. MBLA0076]|uniref:Protoheme IX farnesyltransferase n=1 Tax=Haloferax litoreum TaxID=2666140 RepID=A0A6A8GC60_9EURY|nr:MULTISPECIES: heme o synthase [Haloferax]KAB1191922.1 protoheme IX farnesyltransferase [Haloferax sp. CBA1148]MRX20359.1 protoheme IX farnesyltransferase [Haloferax litoreum]